MNRLLLIISLTIICMLMVLLIGNVLNSSLDATEVPKDFIEETINYQEEEEENKEKVAKMNAKKVYIENELAGIKLGDSIEVIEQKLGKPLSAEEENDEKMMLFHGIAVTLKDNIATKIYVEKDGFKTPKGLEIRIYDGGQVERLLEVYGEPDLWEEMGDSESGRTEAHYKRDGFEFVAEITEEGHIVAVWVEKR